MTDTKWTKGPWEVGVGSSVVAEFFIIADPFRDGTYGPVLDEHTQEANAHLIAAAPELYSLVDHVLGIARELGFDPGDTSSEDPDFVEWHKRAVAVTAKTRGEA